MKTSQQTFCMLGRSVQAIFIHIHSIILMPMGIMSQLCVNQCHHIPNKNQLN